MQTLPIKVSYKIKCIIPYCITTPRQVLLRYQESVSKMLDDLVASTIIAKETRTADWCSPVFLPVALAQV